AFAGTVSATRTLVASVAPVAELAFALGIMQTAMFVGNSAGPLLGGVLADRIGYGPVFLLTGLILALAGLAVFALVHEDFTPVPPAPKTSDEHGLAALKTSAVTSFSVVFEVPGLLALIATLFLVQAGVSAVAPILALFVDDLLGAGSSAAAGGASTD